MYTHIHPVSSVLGTSTLPAAMNTVFLFFALVAGIFAQDKPGAVLRLNQEALDY
ncbi:bactericidal permeability-increasing protein, partial [Biomphalaria glabrata]